MDAYVVLTVLWWCVKPSTVAPALLLLGIGLLVFGRRRTGVVALAVSVFVLLNALVLPTARVLATALERRVEPVAVLPATVDGIIVLGGNGAVRLPPFAELAARYPEATLVFSGGVDEAAGARRFLSDFDGLLERTISENHSRNTVENASFSKALVRPEPKEVWVLVTSAMHAARARRTFEGAGWSVVAYPALPCDTEPGVSGLDYGFGRLDEALREWLAALSATVLGFSGTTGGSGSGEAALSFGDAG